MPSSAHNARYDAERSADIFCLVCNRLRDSYAAAAEARRANSAGSARSSAKPAADEPPLETEIPPL